MSFDIKKAVFITNHHRRCWFFERTVRMILEAGGRWVIQNTSGPNEFGMLAEDIRNHPLVQYVETGNLSYDAGMSRFKSSGIVPVDAEVIVLMDNDLFLFGLDGLQRYLDEFVDGGYDFVSHTVGIDHNAGKYEGKEIAPLVDLTFSEPGAGNMPADICTPNPHFENAYLLYSKKAWDGMTPHDLSHHRRVVMKMAAIGAKIGTHRVDKFQWSYTQWGGGILGGWHHVGNLFTYFYHLENLNTGKWKPESEFDLYRAGFFNAQERSFGPGTYSNQVRRNLHILNAHMGGQEKVMKVWDDLNRGTCMESA